MYINTHTYYSLKYGTIEPQRIWNSEFGIRNLELDPNIRIPVIALDERWPGNFSERGVGENTIFRGRSGWSCVQNGVMRADSFEVGLIFSFFFIKEKEGLPGEGYKF